MSGWVLVALNAELGRGMAMNLMLGDCLERMKEIPDGSVDMILADPPYGTTACKWDTVIPFDAMWEQLKRIIKPNGAVVLFGSEPFSSALRMSNIKQYKYDWVWKKTRPSGCMNAKKQPLRDIESISVFYKKQCLYCPQGIKDCEIEHNITEGRAKNGGILGKNGKKIGKHKQTKTNYPRQVLEFSSVHNVGSHPTQKPVALMEYLIKTYTHENETVLDFCMGSGTSGIAAKNTGRKFIGIEKDAGYFEIAKQRLCV